MILNYGASFDANLHKNLIHKLTHKENLMKKLAFSLIVAAAGMMAVSANAMSPKTVQYACQGGKNINVKYIFNDADLPTKAVASLSGKTVGMPINLNASDMTSSVFGFGGYTMTADYIDAKSYNQAGIATITDPNNKILFKNCNPK